MKLPTKTLERKLFNSGYGYICAVDEVGMGCLAGPVTVCAVGMTPDFYKKERKKLVGLRESKLLTARQREVFAKELLKEKSLTYSISYCHPKKIDSLNIYQASREAMRRALKKIQPDTSMKTIVLVDGNKKIQNLEFDQQAIVKGDQKVFAIACASIIAKVHRDKVMDRYAKRYPAYGFEQHKGYSTKVHQEQLNLLGPCPIHRRSFRLKY
jgi:ribonuclease HII